MNWNIHISREHSAGGNVFAVIFLEGDRQMFGISPISVGAGVVVVQPQMEGEWRDISVVRTPEPLLPCMGNYMPYMPSPLPESVSKFYLNVIVYDKPNYKSSGVAFMLSL